MPKINDLKPCPFCGQGSPVHMVVQRGTEGWRDRYYVLCDYREGGCGASGGTYHTEAEAFASWQNRFPFQYHPITCKYVPGDPECDDCLNLCPHA